MLEDFKPLYRQAGVFAKPTSFIFTDKEIKEEGFLEYINIFLNTGELPNLFARDEMDAIYGELSEVWQKEGHKTASGEDPTYDDLWTFFIERVRHHLHIVLCFSPVGDKFRTRAQKFPALINGCTIDWFLQWPAEALVDVATSLMGSFEIEADDGVDTRGSLITHMGQCHTIVYKATHEYFARYRRYAYVTPKSYLAFIKQYQTVYSAKLNKIRELATNINSGLVKLEQAASDVEVMKVELKEVEATLAVAQEKSAVLLQEITASTAKAEKKKSEVQGVKDTLAVEKDAIAEDKRIVDEDLAAASRRSTRRPSAQRDHEEGHRDAQLDEITARVDHAPLRVRADPTDGGDARAGRGDHGEQGGEEAAVRRLVEVGDQDDGAVDLPREPAELPQGRDQ